jgi:Xaa-Pro dipeptidase
MVFMVFYFYTTTNQAIISGCIFGDDMNTPKYFPKIYPYSARQENLYRILQSVGLDSLILNAGPSLTYLTGLHFHLSERPVLVFFIPNKTPIIVLPELEQEKLKHLPYELEDFPYGEDSQQWSGVLKHATQSVKLNKMKNGVEPKQMRLLELNLLLTAASIEDFIPADDCVSKLRMYKEEGELCAMRQAVSIAEQALIATLPFAKTGMLERELAAELTLQLFRAGTDPQLVFSPIVSSGPNSANPHATPSDRPLTPGDLLVIDWGASFNGYASDITRTFCIGQLETKFIEIGKVVLDANIAARRTAKPGIAIDLVDRAARSVIESAGYGKFFTHRTGHGLGMEGHEEPYIRADNLMLLEPGMTFTIEPGIYLPDRNGVRIEDDIVITDTGSESLTSLPREIIQLV